MQLDALRVFMKVAELASFTRAGEHLGLSKARASTLVRDADELASMFQAPHCAPQDLARNLIIPKPPEFAMRSMVTVNSTASYLSAWKHVRAWMTWVAQLVVAE